MQQQPRRRYHPEQSQEPVQISVQAAAQQGYFCSQCGKQAAFGAKFCTECGASIHGSEATHQQTQQPIVINVTNDSTNANTVVIKHDAMFLKSRWTAFFLCLLGGWLGLHRFYLGKIWSGILWAFTAGFFFFGWGIDLLLLLFNASSDKWGRPLR